MFGELVVDNFAGGGGASTGIEAAIGRPVDIAINHSPQAIAMHAANHPRTKHYCENIWEVDPREACGSRPVGLLWASPDCTHFSRAKGGQPRSKEVRALAHVVIRWARAVKPRTILLENVEEFQTWGPLDENGFPIKAREGEDFRAWLAELTDCGYDVSFRTLVAADYGAPTTRKRLFLVVQRRAERDTAMRERDALRSLRLMDADRVAALESALRASLARWRAARGRFDPRPDCDVCGVRLTADGTETHDAECAVGRDLRVLDGGAT